MPPLTVFQLYRGVSKNEGGLVVERFVCVSKITFNLQLYFCHISGNAIRGQG